MLQMKDVEHDVCGVEKVKTSKTNDERQSTEAEEDWPIDQGGDSGVFISFCSSMHALSNADKIIKFTLSCISLSHSLARSLARSLSLFHRSGTRLSSKNSNGDRDRL
jgi:hypothetical protein